MTEVIPRGSGSCMQACVDELLSQSTRIGMLVNGKKTKEMLIGSVIKNPPVPVSLNDTTVDQVSTFKLLGMHISNDLKWTQHIDAATCKIASRLYFLRLLKRAAATYSDLMSFYCTVIHRVGHLLTFYIFSGMYFRFAFMLMLTSRFMKLIKYCNKVF